MFWPILLIQFQLCELQLFITSIFIFTAMRLKCIDCFIEDIDYLLTADGELLGVRLFFDGVELSFELLVEGGTVFLSFAFKHQLDGFEILQSRRKLGRDRGILKNREKKSSIFIQYSFFTKEVVTFFHILSIRCEMLQKTLHLLSNISSHQLLTPLAYLFTKHPHKKHRDRFKLDYDYFSSIPIQNRDNQLQKIVNLKRSNIQLIKDIPFFPINEIWEHEEVKYMTHTWEPPHNLSPRAVVIFMHSLNGHTALCGELAKELTAAGIVMTGYDFKNFGQSGGSHRGMLQSFEDLVNTSQQFVMKTKQRYPGLKIFVCGMSMGGAVAFNLSIKSPTLISGNIFLSPSIRENHMHFPFMKKLTLLLSYILPKQPLLKSNGRNGSKYLLDDYNKKDPYIYHGRLWTKTVQEIIFAMAKTKREYSNFQLPYLLIQSGSDKLVDPFACLDLEKASPSPDKTTVIIHGMWHAIWFDEHVYDVIKIVEEWLEERI